MARLSGAPPPSLGDEDEESGAAPAPPAPTTPPLAPPVGTAAAVTPASAAPPPPAPAVPTPPAATPKTGGKRPKTDEEKQAAALLKKLKNKVSGAPGGVRPAHTVRTTSSPVLITDRARRLLIGSCAFAGILILLAMIVAFSIDSEPPQQQTVAPAQPTTTTVAKPSGPPPIQFTELTRIRPEWGFGWNSDPAFVPAQSGPTRGREFGSSDVGKHFFIYIAKYGTRLCLRISRKYGPWEPYYLTEELPEVQFTDKHGKHVSARSLIGNITRVHFQLLDPSIRIAYYWMQAEQGKRVCVPDYRRSGLL